jgi:23S rRNA pseudouridine2457 synthase
MSRYLAFYKPFEVLSQFTDRQGRRTLKDYVRVPGVYAAGRLDYRSEGLLLLTDDGDLIHRLTSPRYEHPKTYLAQVEGVVSGQAIQRLNSEIVLPALQTKTAQATIIPDPQLPPRSKPVRDYHPTTWLEVILQEGKKHQVRRMTAAVGFPTLRLVRVAIGSLKLGALQPGQWRHLRTKELRMLRRETRNLG